MLTVNRLGIYFRLAVWVTVNGSESTYRSVTLSPIASGIFVSALAVTTMKTFRQGLQEAEGEENDKKEQ